MNIGICRIDLEFPDSHSLKDKRKALRSIVERVQSRFNVSIAEVDHHDNWRVATLGITCVSSDTRHANKIISKLVQYVEECRWDAVMSDYHFEMLSGI